MKARLISQERQIVVERRKDHTKASFGHLSFLRSVFRMGVTEIKKGVAHLIFCFTYFILNQLMQITRDEETR